MNHVPLHDSRVQQVVEIAAARPGTAVFVHCGVLSVGVRRKLGLPSQFDLRLGDPLGVARLALAYPNLPFVVPHFGAGLFREALMAADTCPNIHLDTSSSNSWIRYTPGLTLEAVFKTALSVVGARRLLFGTDSSFFPRGWQRGVYEAQKAAIASVGLPAADEALIFGGNFERLFPVRLVSARLKGGSQDRALDWPGPLPPRLKRRGATLRNFPAAGGNHATNAGCGFVLGHRPDAAHGRRRPRRVRNALPDASRHGLPLRPADDRLDRRSPRTSSRKCFWR